MRILFCFVVVFFFQENVILGSDYPFPLGEHHPGKLIEDVYKDDLELRVREQSHSVSRFFFLPLIKRRRRRFLNSLLMWSRNFATMVTWRHTSPLYKHWYRLITVEPRWRSLKRGVVISRFFFIHYTVTGAENIVRYIPRTSLYKGSTVRKRKRNRPHPSPQVLTFVPIRSFPFLWIPHNPHPLPPPPPHQFSLEEV